MRQEDQPTPNGIEESASVLYRSALRALNGAITNRERAEALLHRSRCVFFSGVILFIVAFVLLCAASIRVVVQ